MAPEEQLLPLVHVIILEVDIYLFDVVWLGKYPIVVARCVRRKPVAMTPA